MNDILFGNNNSEVITKLSKRYFKKNKVRNLAALLAIILTAFLFTSITSLAFNMASSIQLSLQMQKGSKADSTLGYMTEEQYEQLVNSDFVEQAGHRRIIGYASNTSSHSIEINYADSVQQELTFCVPTHGAAPEKANEIATTDLALKALGVEPEIGAEVPLEFELRGENLSLRYGAFRLVGSKQ
jgi:putative ABC transport system permease protein